MQNLLFLCHRIPYPPNKGDKVRAFHLLQALAKEYTVHLGAFVDTPEDWQHCTLLNSLCSQTCYRGLSPRRARVLSLAGLFSGRPLSFSYYHDPVMQRWVDQLTQQCRIDAIVVFSSTMAPYVERHRIGRRILDFVDVDSEKWRQYAQTASWPMRWVYAREGHKLLAAERRFASSFDVSTFVSEAEAQLFRHRAPECARRVKSVPNGVDSAYFDPSLPHADPYAGRGWRTLVFTGAMDYRANIDAAQWFARQVLPLIQRLRPDVLFVIAGARPARAVLALAALPGVEVTGAVPDMRPYLAHAAAAVAPLRIARGIQNKVLEALAMNRPVVLTPEAATGLIPVEAGYMAQGTTAEELAGHALAFLADGSREEGDNVRRTGDAPPRQYVLEHYSWCRQLAHFHALLRGHDAMRDQARSLTSG